MNFDEIVNGMKDEQLRKKIKDMASTPKGQNVIKKLNAMDKSKLESFAKGINSGNVSKEMLMKQLNSNPKLLDQISDFLSKL